jgi:hypothetical protein
MEKRESPEAPHKTVIWVKALTYELLHTGECSGIPVYKQEIVLEINDNNKSVCIENTDRFMEEIKQCLK